MNLKPWISLCILLLIRFVRAFALPVGGPPDWHRYSLIPTNDYYARCRLSGGLVFKATRRL